MYDIERSGMDKIEIFEGDYERKQLRDHRIISINYEIEDGESKDIVEDLNIIAFSEDTGIPITLLISSPGGNAFAGTAILHAIQEVQRKGFTVVGHVYGQAMSMAFFILQCCDKRVMGHYDHLMCHGITTGFFGDLKNIDAEQKIMKKMQEDFANLIAARSTAPEGSNYRDPAYWANELFDNTPKYYDCDEALEMGLIDEVE